MKKHISLIALLLLAATAFNAPDALGKEALPDCGKAPGFTDGQTVCFLGDSITQGALYQGVIEYFYATRYPERRLTFWNCGIAGDTAQSILGVESYRLQVDVLGHKPDVVALMLGMNDVNRGAYSPENKAQPEQLAATRNAALRSYQENVGKIVGKIQATGAKVIFLTPSIYEENPEVTGDFGGVCKGVNGALGACAEWLRAEAPQRQAGLVDFHAVLGALNAREQVAHNDFSLLKLGRTSGLDRVHPYMPCHWIMACIFLKAQGHSPVVSQIAIDAKAGKATENVRAAVEHIQTSTTSVSFDATSEALPMAVGENGAAALQVFPIAEELSREIVSVRGLAAGLYELRIDNAVVGRFSGQELATGVNLGGNKATPQYQQSRKVYELTMQRLRVCGKIRAAVARRYGAAKYQKLNPLDDALLIKNMQEQINTSRAKGEKDSLTMSLEAVRTQAQLEEEYQMLGRSMREAACPVRRHYALALVSPQNVSLWPEQNVPGGPVAEPQLTMHQKNWKYTWVPFPSLEIYRPAEAEGALPAVIVCPGGGYGVLAYEKEGTEAAAWLNSIGATAMVLKYRVPKCREGALQDIQRAVRLARAHAVEWKINPNQLGVMGFSAGGDLCVKLCAQGDRDAYPVGDGADRLSSRPDFALLIYPAFFDKMGRVDSDGKLEADVMPSAATPPMFIVHTEDDKSFVNGTKTYVNALAQAGVRHRFHLCRSGGHGYGLRLQENNEDLKRWPAECRNWLQGLGLKTNQKDL